MEGERAEAQTKNEAATPQQIVNRSKVEHLLSPLKSPASHLPNLEMEEEEEEMLKRLKSMERERAEAQTKNESATPQQIENPSNIELLLSSVKSSVKSSANRCLSFQTEKEEMLEKEIADLKKLVARERLKNKWLKHCDIFELVLLLVLVFCLYTFFLLLVLDLSDALHSVELLLIT